jgi:hypothetical protein
MYNSVFRHTFVIRTSNIKMVDENGDIFKYNNNVKQAFKYCSHFKGRSDRFGKNLAPSGEN